MLFRFLIKMSLIPLKRPFWGPDPGYLTKNIPTHIKNISEYTCKYIHDIQNILRHTQNTKRRRGRPGPAGAARSVAYFWRAFWVWRGVLLEAFPNEFFVNRGFNNALLCHRMMVDWKFKFSCQRLQLKIWLLQEMMWRLCHFDGATGAKDQSSFFCCRSHMFFRKGSKAGLACGKARTTSENKVRCGVAPNTRQANTCNMRLKTRHYAQEAMTWKQVNENTKNHDCISSLCIHIYKKPQAQNTISIYTYICIYKECIYI